MATIDFVSLHEWVPLEDGSYVVETELPDDNDHEDSQHAPTAKQ